MINEKVNNLLPKNGIVKYYDLVFNKVESDRYFKILSNDILWEHDQAIIFGKRITTKRKVAWYGEKEFTYTYSKITKKAHLWTPTLLELKNKIEEISKTSYNSCLLNLYEEGTQGMAWHSDSEKELKEHGAIASVSFGADRKFCFKHKKTKEKQEILLRHGSLLVMKGETQTHWLHSLPATKKIHEPRINLTFRTIIS